MVEKRRGLGRGLGALIPESTEDDLNKSSFQAAAKIDKASRNAIKNKTQPATAKDTAAYPRRQPISSAQKGESQQLASPKQEGENGVNKEGKQNRAKASKNVSRETSTKKTASTWQDQKKKRADMGLALRSTTTTRRPVDFFFGEEQEKDNRLVPVPGAEFAEIAVKDIHPNRKQPRTEFAEDDMAELVHSIKEIGVLQPIVVRPSKETGSAKYELVMGERRWRASQQAGLKAIPAIIRATKDIDLLRDALLENLHRSQLNPIEEAAAYQQLLDEFNTTQEELAQRIGRSRPQISNTIRLLKLPALVQRRVAAGLLTSGHARALLSLKSQADIEKISQQIVAEGLSVRATEELVAAVGEEPKKESKKAEPQKHHERLDYVADAFADKLDTNVKIQLGARKGKMTIEFASVEDLNRIISVLDPSLETHN